MFTIETSAVVTFVLASFTYVYQQWRTDRRRRHEEEKLIAAQSNENLWDEGPLFQLYNEQLRIYQNETRSRARNSFFWAIVAMMVGFAVLAVGAGIIVVHGQKGVLSGSALAAIGGALSAFITKTLLDVHKVSLVQLNRYFKQPVLNSHILTCVRLIKAIPPGTEQNEMYKQVTAEVVRLIANEQSQSVVLHDNVDREPSRTGRKGRGEKSRQKGETEAGAQQDG